MIIWMLIPTVQEKYGGSTKDFSMSNPRKAMDGRTDEFSSDSSPDEDEDDDGELALGALDDQVQSTLEAIRNKDPRVYDASVKFYTDPNEENAGSSGSTDKKQKPMYISDYHRKNLLEGGAGSEDGDSKPPTYQEQQDDLKNSIVKEMHAAIVDPISEDENIDGAEDVFLVKKVDLAPTVAVGTETSPRKIPLDVESADKDPEAYLSNFMSTRGWVTNESSKFQPFESDDEEEEHRAEAFEEAYNLRFEDPGTSNEKLMSHARDTAAKYSVRQDNLNSRKKKRTVELSHKDLEKKHRSEEKARLRKLKVAELEEKVKMIKEAAGLDDEDIPEDGWSELLEDAWDDKKWESTMRRRFGDEYYEGESLGVGNGGQNQRTRKLKKPKWKDEIEIDDLVPGFDSQQANSQDTYNATDANPDLGEREKAAQPKTKSSSGQDKRKLERLERRKIEEIVDGRLAVDESLVKSGKKHAGFFHYRETSPISLGLTANDILMASDSQLNQFAGLKKLATFRDPDRKRKDKRYLGKKQRLRQWRKETFGDEQGPTKTLSEVLAGQDQTVNEPSQRQLSADEPKMGAANKKRSRKGIARTLKTNT